MSVLTPLAVENADVLRALEAGGFGTVADLARKFGRDAANFRKTLKALERDGLVVVDADAAHPLPILGPAGKAVLAALDRAERPEGPPPQGEGDRAAVEGVAGHIALLHAQIAPDPLNPRKHFDDGELAELAASIAQDGLLENLVVRHPPPEGEGDRAAVEGVAGRSRRGASTPSVPASGRDTSPSGGRTYRLVAGERRWRAIGTLITDGRWPADRRIVCKVVDIDDAAHRRLALVENLQRQDLRPIDEAEGLRALMELTGAGTAEVAKEIGFTQRYVQQRLQLLQLPVAKRDALNDGAISIEEARRWIAARPALLEGLTPHQLLVMLEVAWEVAKTSNGWWTDIPCGWEADLDTHAQGFALDATDTEARKVLPLLHVHRGEVYLQDARTKVSLSSAAYGHLITLTGGDDKLLRAEIEPHLRRARLAVLPADNPPSADYGPQAFKKVDELFRAKQHFTPWLNGPFAVHPQIKAEVEARVRERAKTEAENAEEQARRTAHAEARAVEIEAAEQLSIQVLRGFQAKSWSAAEMKQAFADLGAPLPWTWRDDPHATHSWNCDEGMLDADGGQVEIEGLSPALMRLVMAALNAAVDELPIVTITPDPDDEDEATPEAAADDDQVTFVDEPELLEAAPPDEPLPDYLARLAGAEAQP